MPSTFTFEEASKADVGFSFEEASKPVSSDSFESQLAAQGITPAAYEKALAQAEQQAPKEPARGLLGGLAHGFGHSFEATAKGPGVFTLSNDRLEEELRRKQEELTSREAPGAAGKIGEFAGGLAGTLAQALPIGVIGKKPGIAAMFASSGAYDAFIRAGLRALAEGKDYKEAVDIGKKTAAVGALGQAAVATVFPTGTAGSLGEALIQGLKPAAVGVGAVGAENITQRALGLKTPVTEGMLETAGTLGLFPAAKLGLAKILLPRSVQAAQELPPTTVTVEPPPAPEGPQRLQLTYGGLEAPEPVAPPPELPPSRPPPALPPPTTEPIAPATVQPATEAPTPPPAEVAKLGASRFKNQQGDPIGTTYHATPEDWADWQKVKSGMEQAIKGGGAEAMQTGEFQELFRENERIKNKYGGMPPEPPKPTTAPESGEAAPAAATPPPEPPAASPEAQLQPPASPTVQPKKVIRYWSPITKPRKRSRGNGVQEIILDAQGKETYGNIVADELTVKEAKDLAAQKNRELLGVENLSQAQLHQLARSNGIDIGGKTDANILLALLKKRYGTPSLKPSGGAPPSGAPPPPPPPPTGGTPPSPEPPPGGPSPQAMGITLNPQVQAAFNDAWQNIGKLRDKFVNAMAARPNKQIAAATKDAADNIARITGDNISTGLKLIARRAFGAQSDQALDAVFPMVESQGDRTVLARFVQQASNVVGGLRARKAAQFALANYDRLQELVSRFKGDMLTQLNAEHAAKIATEFREAYFPHVFDVNKLPNQGEEFFTSSGRGVGGRFQAGRKFNTIYDAVEAGYGNAIKSMNAADVAAGRIRSGMNKVLDAGWADIFRNVPDPTTHDPLITDPVVDRNGQRLAPTGYELVELFPGRTIAVHKGYGSFFDALTGRSKVEAFEAMGLPVGKFALQVEAGLKHGLLLFDTFHASRIIQKAVFLSPSHFAPQLQNIRQFAKMGRSLLEYADRDLDEAVRQNLITPEIAAAVRANRSDANLLISRGLNVGQIQEALRAELIRKLPVIGTLNKWIFEKVTRGALMEGGLLEFDRIKRNNPNWSDTQVADKVVKDLNVYFGNIGRQGLLTSASSRDLARLMFLAPQWVESMAKTEAFGYGQLLKAPFTGNFGTMAKAMATGIGAYFIATQILNLITKGHPTWENEEEGHKLDAWIPDWTGKTPGFWLSPLSVPAELTHDVIRYFHKKEDSREVLTQIARNKLSPYGRFAWTIASGRNYADYKIGDTWKTVKEASLSMMPTPIPLSGTFGGYPGQTQRQLLGSAGVKVEPAESALKQLRDKATRFRKAQPDAKPDEGHYDVYAESPYNNLRQALRAKNEAQVADAIEQLRKGRSDADIEKAMGRSVKSPFTGKRALEKPFFDSLSNKEQELYQRAIEERLANLDLFLKVWEKRK